MYEFGDVSFLIEASVDSLSMGCPVHGAVQSILSVVSSDQSYLFLICSISAWIESAYLICGFYLELAVPRGR